MGLIYTPEVTERTSFPHSLRSSQVQKVWVQDLGGLEGLGSGFRGLGLRALHGVQGSPFWVCGLESRIWVLGYGSSGFRV